MMLATDGGLYACGASEYGRLGRATCSGDAGNVFRKASIRSSKRRLPQLGAVESNERRFAPVDFGDDVSLARIWAGGASSFAMDSHGNLWGFGYNGAGNLGLGDAEHRVRYVVREEHKRVIPLLKHVLVYVAPIFNA